MKDEVRAVITSTSVAGIGDMWWEAWNRLKWYKLEFWNQTTNQETDKYPQHWSSSDNWNNYRVLFLNQT